MPDGIGTLKSETYDESVFKRDCKIMELFIKNAETYTKLSAGALLLTVTFAREILGIKKEAPLHPDWFLILSWVCFLAAILSGAFYQYVAIKFLEWKSGVPRTHKNFMERLVRRPWPVYGVMLIAFYLGCIFFTVSALQNLRATPGAPDLLRQTLSVQPALQTSLC
jgi:hypothetical protein